MDMSSEQGGAPNRCITVGQIATWLEGKTGRAHTPADVQECVEGALRQHGMCATAAQIADFSAAR